MERLIGPMFAPLDPSDQCRSLIVTERPTVRRDAERQLDQRFLESFGQSEGRMGGEHDPEARALHPSAKFVEGYRSVVVAVPAQIADQALEALQIAGAVGLSEVVPEARRPAFEGLHRQSLDQSLD